MRKLCWTLIGLAAVAFVAGTVSAFAGRAFLLPAQGYWRGAMGFLAFAIALRLMEERN
jgi:hypothetical protein